MRRRLLYVINDTTFFASHRLPVAIAAKEAGYEVHLAALRDKGADRIERAGIHLHPIPFDRNGLNPLVEAKTIVALARLVRALKPDLSHHVTIKPVLYGGLLARALRVPALVSAVSGLGFAFSDHQKGVEARVAGMVARQLYRSALFHPNSRVIFQNDVDRDTVLAASGLDPEKAVMIRGSGADPTQFSGEVEALENGAPPLVVMAARLLWEKGVGEFVEAARIVRERGIEARFALIGAPPPHNPKVGPSEDDLALWREEGVVELWGLRDDVPAILQEQAAILCHPSYYREGVPKVLIEGAMAARPIVTTDWPGCRDAVSDGITGILCAPRSPVSLADALERLLRDGALRREMGAAGRERAVREFSIDRVIANTLEVYETLLNGVGR